MTKTNSKKALLSSAFALVLSVAMLIGTTFAWFTDTASTGVNKIVSGNLKVDIVGANSDSHISTLNFTKAAGAQGEAFLWEPGCRYLTEGFRIANNGNLALKWKAEINKGGARDDKVAGSTIAKDGKSLLDVIDFYVVTSKEENAEAVKIEDFTGNLTAGAKSGVYYIKGVMKTSAGNDYQGLTLDGITITVYATQLNSEFDSFGPDYDENAEYPIDTWNGGIASADELKAATDDTNKVVTVDSGKLLAALTNEVNEGKSYDGYTIKLTKNLDLNGNEWTPIGQKNGNKFKGTFDGQGYVVTGLKISEAKADAFDGYVAFFGGTDGATIKNLTVAGSVTGKEAAGIVGKGVNTTLENCHNKATITATESKAAGIVASLDKGTLKNCTNSGAITTKGAWPAAGIVAWCNPNAAIENCQNFGDVTVTGIGDTSQAGGICGNLGSSSVVKNCINSGRISASLAGGVAGRAKGADAQQIQIVNFTNTGSIVASNIAGGVVGDAQQGVKVENCTINGTVSGTKAAGGIFGSTQGNAQSAVTGCTIGATVSSDTANRAGKVVGILGGVVELKLDQSTANDIGCFKGATLTIIGETPNNIVFTEITNGFKGDINGFVHENIGHPETIKINGKTYSYLGSNGQQTAYTWTVG